MQYTVTFILFFLCVLLYSYVYVYLYRWSKHLRKTAVSGFYMNHLYYKSEAYENVPFKFKNTYDNPQVLQ